ncbi:hypothetical protein MVEN_00163600 [Mycena venus]|uniref:Uncharacterized protein n=1 Tax=Mycena venus TaxID=2733690 RepID=A0A8H7DEB9_9AGAR|nr:hypothetical protein MVEN_00163600 [Mycena venus]
MVGSARGVTVEDSWACAATMRKWPRQMSSPLPFLSYIQANLPSPYQVFTFLHPVVHGPFRRNTGVQRQSATPALTPIRITVSKHDIAPYIVFSTPASPTASSSRSPPASAPLIHDNTVDHGLGYGQSARDPLRHNKLGAHISHVVLPPTRLSTSMTRRSIHRQVLSSVHVKASFVIICLNSGIRRYDTEPVRRFRVDVNRSLALSKKIGPDACGMEVV